MAFNVTWDPYTLANVTNFYQIMEYGNSVTENSFVSLICISVFFISYISFRRYPSDIALAASSYIATVLTMIMRATGLVADWLVIAFTIATAATTLLMWIRREG